MNKRGSGVLLHISSLPSPFGIGDLGPSAYEFADILGHTLQSFWQILPLNPTTSDGNPYHGESSFAGNPDLISPELLLERGLIDEGDMNDPPHFPENEVVYSKVSSYKKQLLEIAYENFLENGKNEAFENFCASNSWWLDDYVLFSALKDHYDGASWKDWPPDIRDREKSSIEKYRKGLEREIERKKFFQYIFFDQWFSLKDYCNKNGIKIFGDLPVYLNYESADVWKNPELFKLDEEKRLKVYSGVPPDDFSDTGQLWRHPIYRWDKLKEQDYAWWFKRLDHKLELYDLLRIDHFRGYVAYWEVPAGENTAASGNWVDGPALDLFPKLIDRYPNMPIIVEDLGEITPDVIEIRDRFDFPGMEVLLFAFGEDFPTNPHLPHNHKKNSLACTGTHDNNTVIGWFENEAGQNEKERLFEYLGYRVPTEEIHWSFIRLAMMSVANLASFPIQDILGLGEESRMNNPAGSKKNWRWRLSAEQMESFPKERLRNITSTYGRSREA